MPQSTQKFRFLLFTALSFFASSGGWARPECAVNKLPFGAGDGSQANPYRICTLAQLRNISASTTLSSVFYKITKNLNLDPMGTEVNYPPISIVNGAKNITIDGNGKTLSNFNNLSRVSSLGLFTTIGLEGPSILIKNLKLQNVNIDGGAWVGAFMGDGANLTLENCSASGVVRGYGDYIGGLIGTQTGYGKGVLRAHFTGIVSGNNYVGGLVGSTQQRVLHVYTSATVEGRQWVGGILGMHYAQWGEEVNFALAYGNVNAYFGDPIAPCYVQNEGCDYYAQVLWPHKFYNTDNFIQNTMEDPFLGGTGKTTLELKSKKTYANWDRRIWNIRQGRYPTLK